MTYSVESSSKRNQPEAHSAEPTTFVEKTVMKTIQYIHGDGVTPVTAYFQNSSRVPCAYAVRVESLKSSVTNVTRHPIELIFHDGMTAMTAYFQNSSRVPRAHAVRTELLGFLLSCRHAVILCPSRKQMLNHSFRPRKSWVYASKTIGLALVNLGIMPSSAIHSPRPLERGRG